MSKITLLVVGLIFVVVSISCKSFMPGNSTRTNKAQVIDFTTPGKALNVKVEPDKKQTASGKVSTSGGSVSLTAADGSKFVLDVPANALEADTTITMTAVKTLDGAPLDTKTPTAVQLEPSGLFFKEMATLTIVPAREIPVKDQIIFGYEGDGKDYHLAVVDPKSKDIKIKLMRFSGAGVGTGSDAAWAANLMLQAGAAETRLNQKIGETLQELRRRMILGDEDSAETNELADRAASVLEQFEDQVLLKEIVAADLDCQHAGKALQSLLHIRRMGALLGMPEKPSWADKMDRLLKIIEGCKWAYQIVGGLDDWQTNTRVCDIMKPFTLTSSIGISMQLSGGLSGSYTYSGGPFNAHGTGTYTISLPEGLGKPGTMTGGGVGSAGDHTGSGTEKYTLTPIEPCK
jgi:hypothetical protein